MAMKAKAPKDETINIVEITQGKLSCNILGLTPLIFNRVSEKAKQQLLMPPARKNAADKASSLKHNPLQEFRDSPYTAKESDAPTLLRLPAETFKGAMRSAALDMPGAAKSVIGRLTYVNGAYVPIYGIPKLLMSVTRSADINRTPDIRTRAIVARWACRLTVTYVMPILREQAIVNLLAAAGIIRGVGDWRQEKGSGSYGQFEIVANDDARFREIVKTGARVAQAQAMESAECYDAETAELLAWYVAETNRRGFKVAA